MLASRVADGNVEDNAHVGSFISTAVVMGVLLAARRISSLMDSMWAVAADSAASGSLAEIARRIASCSDVEFLLRRFVCRFALRLGAINVAICLVSRDNKGLCVYCAMAW